MAHLIYLKSIYLSICTFEAKSVHLRPNFGLKCTAL